MPESCCKQLQKKDNKDIQIVPVRTVSELAERLFGPQS
jgi:predicted ATP-dependent protease